jgi:hypothetical protein
MAVAEGIYEPFRALIDCSRDVIESPKLSRRSGEVHVHVYPESLLTDLNICPRDHRSIFIRRLDEPVAFKPLFSGGVAASPDGAVPT